MRGNVNALDFANCHLRVNLRPRESAGCWGGGWSVREGRGIHNFPADQLTDVLKLRLRSGHASVNTGICCQTLHTLRPFV